MHILAPAVHVPKEDVAQLFSRITGEELPPDIETLVATAKKLLREKYFHADIGMSGANVVAADTGTLFHIEVSLMNSSALSWTLKSSESVP